MHDRRPGRGSTKTASPALEELAREDAGSRAQFLKMVGGAGAAGALAIFVAACGGDDDDRTRRAATAARPASSSDSGAATRPTSRS